MLKKLNLLMMVVVFAFGAVALAACGDDEEPASGGGGGTTTTETTESTEDTETTEDSGGGASDAQIEAAVEQCKQAINAQAQLSDGLKADLEEVCEKAGSGDIEDAQKASVEVCVKIAEEMVPEGSARDQVIASCEQAAP